MNRISSYQGNKQINAKSVEHLMSTSFNSLTTQFRPLTTFKKEPFENIVGKGDNAGNQHFLYFLLYFLPIAKKM